MRHLFLSTTIRKTMNRRFAYTLLCLCLPAFLAKGQQAFNVMDGSVSQYYSKAILLNNVHDYLEAYRNIQSAEHEADANLTEKGIQVNTLSSDQLAYYCGMKRTKAEIAYKLGLYADMDAVSLEIHTITSQWNNDDSATRDNIQAYLYKIDASSYYLKEKYDSAQVCLNHALNVSRDWIEYEFDFFYALRGDFAQLYYKQGQYDKALAQLDTILMHRKFQPNAMIFDMEKIPERRREIQSQRAICLARLGRFDEALKVMGPVVQHFKNGSDKRAYAEALRKKAKILMLQYDATGKYNLEAVTCYQQYLTISRDYIDKHFVQMSESQREQYWMAEQPFVTDCFRLEDKAPGLLYDVALYSKAVLLQMGRDFKEGMTVAEKGKALASIRVKWQDVRDKLPLDGCAIEFIVYEKQGQSHIGALLINKKSADPKFVDLGEVTSISDYPLTERLSVKDVFADTQSKDKINVLYNDSTLHRLIWNDGLVSAIGNSPKVYFSPDGLLHQMGIEYMIPPSLEGKQLYRLTTTRLLTQERRKIQTDKMLVCGGVEYQLSEEDREKGNDELAYSLLSSMDLSVTPLPNSAVEIDSISAIRKNHSADMVLRADSLTESALTQLMGKYHIAHISTHGLFSEVAKIGTEIRPSSTDTQLSKSCLFLSGSEKNLKQKAFDASQHDGILSARELAKMDLRNVDLTVLSACMSGLGYITPDGVYGLQRGLKTAGVKTIISTLWSVDDEASSFFVIQLYKNLEAGMNLYAAFWEARETLKKYEKTYGGSSAGSDASGSYTQRRRITIPKFNKPYYYDAFILIDGIE